MSGSALIKNRVEKLSLIQISYISSISDQSIAGAGISNIIRLPLLIPMACQGFVLWIRVGDKKKRKKERNLWYSTMEFIAKITILSISLVEMGVQGAVVQT